MKKFLVLLCGLWLLGGAEGLAASAVFDPATNILHLPHVRLQGSGERFYVDLLLNFQEMSFRVLEVAEPRPDGCYYGELEGSPYRILLCVSDYRVIHAMVVGGTGEGFMLAEEGMVTPEGAVSFQIEALGERAVFSGHWAEDSFQGTWVYAEGTPAEKRGTWTAIRVE